MAWAPALFDFGDAMTSPFLQDLADLYPDLDAAVLAQSAEGFEAMAVPGGQVLVHEGEPSDALFLLVSGRLAATRSDDHGDLQRLGEIGRGELIGEMSLFTGARRTATVCALRDSRLLRISHDAFFAFMQRHPSVTKAFVKVLVARSTGQSGAKRERLSTLALLNASDGDAASQLAPALAAVLATHTDTRCLDWSAVCATFPGDAQQATDEALARWLNDLEQVHALVITVCDSPDSRWTRLALRQADRVLLVAHANATPPIPEALQDSGAHGNPSLSLQSSHYLRARELVLLHPPNTRNPQATARWLDSARVTRHHHLRQGHEPDLARLARHLMGRSVGLALGGGGARAFAQVGVLHALNEANLPVDTVAGTSMGGVIGALIARGLDHRQVLEAVRELVAMRPFSGLTLPVTSLLSGARLSGALQQLFGDTRMEDLWLRYACVACNLNRGHVEAPQRGPLALWLRASNAVPGIVPPVAINGELYVDGGLLDNVPVDVATQLNVGPVIAVNVSGAANFAVNLENGAEPSGWRAWREPSMPGLGRILMRAMLTGSARHTASTLHQAGLTLTPPLDGFDPNDWHALDALVRAGYDHAQEALATWHR